MKKTIKFIILTLFIWIAFSAFSAVDAASATIKANKTSATVGDSVKVTVTVNAAAWNLQVAGNASGSIVGYNEDAENQTTTKTYTIDTSKAGTYKVSLSGDVTDESKDTADKINTSVSITVKGKETTTTTNKDTATNKNNSTDKTTTTNKDNTTTNKDTTATEKPKEKSNNAYLSTLGVKPKEYDFSDFSKTKTTYNVTVPSDVDSLEVLYKTADSKASVKVSGNKGFETGSDNKITIKVTAEAGNTKTYTINVTKLAEEEEKPGNVIEDEDEDEEGLYLTSLTIGELELSPEFEKDTYSYKAILTDSEVNELEVKAVANNEKANVQISGNKELVEGENTINIILTLDGTVTQTVYQIVVTKEAESGVTTTDNSEDKPSASNNDLIGSIKQYATIAILVIVLMIVAVIVLIILLRRENKRLREDEEYEEEAEDTREHEYNVYKNDINEFANNSMQKDNFIESLYKQRNENFNNEELDEEEKNTLEEIKKQTEEIFREKEIEGQSVEYYNSEIYDNNPLEERRKRRGKGKHSK